MIRETIASALRAIGLNTLADKVAPPKTDKETNATQQIKAEDVVQKKIDSVSWEARMCERDASTQEVSASEKNSCPQKNGCKQRDKNSCGKNSCR